MTGCCCLFLSENIKSYTQKSGKSFEVSFDLPSDSCFIYFMPKSGNGHMEHTIVTRGRLHFDWFDQECSDFELLPPCGLVKDDLLPSCSGTFTFKDGNGNTALQADLEVERE